jgi:hypothetical protein
VSNALPHHHPERPIAVTLNRVHELAPWSRAHSYRLAATGALPVRRAAGKTYVLVADLESFLTSEGVVQP